MNCVKIIFVGYSGAGKTSLLHVLAHKRKANYVEASTIGVDFFDIKMDSNIRLQLWDTAGQERFRSIINIYFRSANIVFFVGDITRYDSIIGLKEFYDQIQSKCGRPYIVLLANKMDLYHEMGITNEDVSMISKEIIANETHYVSAMNPEETQEIMKNCIRNYLKQKELIYRPIPTETILLSSTEQKSSCCR